MNIEPINIPAYKFTLTESEIRSAIDNPAVLVGVLQSALNGNGHDAATPPMRTARQLAKAAGWRAGRSPKAPAKGARKTGKGRFAKEPCLICDKPVAISKMKYHIEHKHPEQAEQAVAALAAKS